MKRRVWLVIGVVIVVGVAVVIGMRILIPESTVEQWKQDVREAEEEEARWGTAQGQSQGVLQESRPTQRKTQAAQRRDYLPVVQTNLDRLREEWTLAQLARCEEGVSDRPDCKWAVNTASGTSQLQWDSLLQHQVSEMEGHRDYLNDLHLWMTDRGDQERTVQWGLAVCSEVVDHQSQVVLIIRDLTLWEQWYWGLEAHRWQRVLADFEESCRQDGLLP